MSKLISIVINCDTREGWNHDSTTIGEFGDWSLAGCRSVDFLTHGIVNKINFFSGYNTEIIVCIDQRMKITDEVITFLERLKKSGQISVIDIRCHPHEHPKWNCYIYWNSLQLATGDYVVHFDQDCVAFREANCNIVNRYMEWLEKYDYVCQPVMGDANWHASTRFFITKRETLDFPEIERCLSQEYVNSRYGKQWWVPCFEQALGVCCNGNVLYPDPQEEEYTIWNWSRYNRGVIAKLNAMPYDQIQEYAKRCGIHGARDLVGQPL